jgi:hypothetical protein
LILKLTVKQAVYGGLLAIAVVALVIDRIFFAEPSKAQAAPELPTAPTPAPAISLAPIAEPIDGLISDHLKSIPFIDLKLMPDAFAPSKAWLAAIQPPPPPPPVLPPAPPPDTTDHRAIAFAAAHKLSAVLKSHNGGVAIVDGEMVSVGQTVDGYILTAVDSTSAHFASGSSVVDLTMDP